MEKTNTLLGRGALFLATMIWGVAFVLMDFTLGSVTTLWILTFRFSGAAVIMLFVSFKFLGKIDRHYLSGGMAMGLALFLAYVTQTYGLMHTTPGKNAFLTAAYCIMVPYLYWITSKTRPDRYNISAALVGFIGIGLISVNQRFSVNIGDALTLVCAFFFAVHIVISGRVVGGRNILLLCLIQFATAGILTAAGALVFEPFPQHVPVQTIWMLVFLTVVATALCLLLQIFGQKHTPPSQTSIIMTFEAVFGVLSSLIAGREELSVKLLAGFLLTFTAFIISETKLGFLKRRKVPVA
ncbi:MAG: DMT family transporter [Spirochaetales bacterium]|nr:DMT family transporter [Spirochaetales bacterium]